MINIKTSTVTLLILQLTSNFDEFTVREENQISIMTYRELSIRQIYERYIGTAAPYRRVRVVSKRPAQSYRGDAGHTHTHTHHSESSQEHRDTLLYHRCLQQEALYFCKRQHVDRPQEHLRADGDCVRSRSRSARVPKHPQNTSATRPENQSEHLMLPDVCVNFINPSPDQDIFLRPGCDSRSGRRPGGAGSGRTVRSGHQKQSSGHREVVQTGRRDVGNGGEDAYIQRPDARTEAPDGAETEPGGHQGEMLGKPQPVHL
ncbi:uncharacterized protein LOC143738887 isoform X2 [Siphateles boraxobius]|uniref:uncharacterized protein LOC143738887 isoform X2 n=1 Tax=Siphateles boraxobius TaxID=180520 RepID=UPI004062E65B